MLHTNILHSFEELVCFSVPASVPISVKVSGPQVLTGPKASGPNKQLVSASIWCSVQGSEVSRRKGTAMLQFRGEKWKPKPPTKVNVYCRVTSPLSKNSKLQ